MSESRTPLPDTLARIDRLVAERGLDRAAILDVKALSSKTGISEEDVRSLLDGNEVPEGDVETRARNRVRFLRQTRCAHKRDRELIPEIAAAIGASTVWVRALLSGEKVPSLKYGEGLEDFFGVEPGFLTAKPGYALNKSLQSVLQDLGEPAHPLSELMARHGLTSVSLRGRTLKDYEESALVAVLKNVLERERDQ
ncbi:transcriptional regulator [Streptomyces sp. SYSU K217416]